MRKVAALAALLAVSDPAAVAQEVGPDRVKVELTVVSAGGEGIRGGEVRIEPWAYSEGGVLPIPAAGVPLELRLEPQRSYSLEITAPAHVPRRLSLVPGAGDRRMRIVLTVDPYVLPELRASAPRGGGRALGAGSVSEIRFADEPLVYATVDDWLRDLPGTAVRGRGPGGRQLVTVRGSRPEDVLVLLDGVPLNSGMTGRADLSTMPTATLEVATLLRGAGSHRYGSGASAGVLLLSSRSPAAGEAGGGVHMASYGEIGVEGHAGASGEKSRLGVSIAARRAANDFSYENRVLPGSPVEVRANADRSSVHAATTGAFGPAYASLRFEGTERGVPGRMGTTLFDSARATDRSYLASLGVRGRTAHLAAGLRTNRLGYRRDGETAEETQRVREIRLTGEASVAWALPLTLGGRLTREDVAGDGIEGQPRRFVGGAYVASVVRVGSLRIDPAVAIDISESGSAVSPELGLTWLANGRWRAWLRLGQGFRLPTFGDLYFASAYQVRPNAHLEAERITVDAELGGVLRSGAAGFDVRAGLTAWHRRTDGPIVWLASAAAVWSPQNLDALESRGVEGELDVTGPTVAGLHWRAQLVGTMQQSRLGFGTNRNPLPYEPATAGRLSLAAWRGGAGVRVDVRHTGKRSTSVSATRELPAYATLDVSLTKEVRLHTVALQVLGSLQNALDESYETIELFPEPGRRLVVRLEASRRQF